MSDYFSQCNCLVLNILEQVVDHRPFFQQRKGDWHKETSRGGYSHFLVALEGIYQGHHFHVVAWGRPCSLWSLEHLGGGQWQGPTPLMGEIFMTLVQ